MFRLLAYKTTDHDRRAEMASFESRHHESNFAGAKV